MTKKSLPGAAKHLAGQQNRVNWQYIKTTEKIMNKTTNYYVIETNYERRLKAKSLITRGGLE
jgi:hypothetical protein